MKLYISMQQKFDQSGNFVSLSTKFVHGHDTFNSGMCNKNKNMDTILMLWGKLLHNIKVLTFTSWINIKIFSKILVNN